MTVFMAFWLGLVQGLTEFFPVSSSGHLVLLQHFFGIREPQLAFDVMVHLGTAAAVVVFTWQEIRSILSALAEIPRLLLRGELAEAFRENQGLRLAALIIFGSIPAGAVGLLFEEQLSALFAKPVLVSLLLFVTGFILLASDKAAGRKKLDQMSFANSFFVGLAQAAAILPGISRSGSTIAAGLKAGLSRETAAKFSFLLSLPAILGAGLLQLGDISGGAVSSGAMIVGFLTAALSGYFAIGFLVMRLQAGRLRSFAYFCFAVGAVCLLAIFL